MIECYLSSNVQVSLVFVFFARTVRVLRNFLQLTVSLIPLGQY